MAEFYVSLSDHEMASQIADMLNRYNRWATRFTAMSLMVTAARYFVELEGSRVVGCASHLHDYPLMSKIQHICVLPQYRGRGIATRLTKMAIVHCDTELVYMTIREDNAASLALARTLGFIFVTKHWFRDHWTLTFGRRRDNDHRSELCRQM